MDWSWMALVRPQLLFFGTSPKNIASYDRAGLNRDHALEWIEQILGDFDQIMILEHLELSLAVLSLQLNIPTDDLIYVAVNQQTGSVSNTNLDGHARLQLHRLNWPDFLLYEAANATLWRKIESLGVDVVNKVADEIKQKSSELSHACLDVPNGATGTKVTRPTVKADKVDDQACRRLAFQGTHTTKLFQVNQINNILKKEPGYRFCTRKIVYGMSPEEFAKKRRFLQKKFEKLNVY